MLKVDHCGARVANQRTGSHSAPTADADEVRGECDACEAAARNSPQNLADIQPAQKGPEKRWHGKCI